MTRKIAAPSNADLTLTCQQIAVEHGVSLSTAHRWKVNAGLPMHGGGRGVRSLTLARPLTREEWAKGCHHVGKLLGISPQAAWVQRNRLIAEGHDLPKLKRGQQRLKHFGKS